MTTFISQSNRNHEAEFLRFIFAIMVFLSHMNVLPNGALAVDFFFLLTGYLTVASIQKSVHKGVTVRSTFDFIIHKIKSFYPELLTATLISILVYFVSIEITSHLLLSAAKTTINGIVPILKMTGVGVSCSDFNGATWYISSMLIGLIVIYPLFVRRGPHPLLFIIGVFICGFLCVYHGRLNEVYTFIGFTYEGNIRAIGELLLGGTSYRAVQIFSKIKLTFFASLLVTLTKYAAIIGIITVSLMSTSHFHGVALCAALLLLIIIFSEKCVDRKLYCNKVSLFLGTLSLPLYLSHRAITACSERLMPWDNCSLLERTLISFIYSIIAALIVLMAGSYIRKKSDKIKQALIYTGN